MIPLLTYVRVYTYTDVLPRTG